MSLRDGCPIWFVNRRTVLPNTGSTYVCPAPGNAPASNGITKRVMLSCSDVKRAFLALAKVWFTAYYFNHRKERGPAAPANGCHIAGGAAKSALMRATVGDRSAGRSNPSGVPRMSSGTTTMVSSRCCTMCAEKRYVSLRSWSGPLSERKRRARPV